MKKRILLTGATGFVGRQIFAALCKADIDLILVVRDSSESRLLQAGVADIVRTADLFKESVEWWAAACQGVDIVIHAAWYAEPGVYMQSPKNLDCLAGTLNLAAGCARADVRRFIGIGSCSEYDMRGGHLSIDTPLRPVTPYGGAKAAAFLALSTILPQQGVEFVWARLFYLYGEGEDVRRLVPYLRARLSAGEPVELTSGTQIRDYLDVVDAGAQIASLALGTVTGSVNICSGHAQTVRELAERIADEYGRRDLLRFGARADNHFDPPCVVGIRSAAC
ncbi:NAD-dependent epimerase/dehydratase family protein [Pusillimonas minor]|uniref:NAD(P)-dependent oxidoreductase n=1 Tax=Pusillimonas minor TaxID=2697024 RepID=A0A842HQJ7_9BURK|nr:NAD(P)-dependent oxidoreductase [Pusillimonas minor]MBC2770597.1 NAD(P)-dependent oxidoreductase [Pusillimonas minor]